MTTAIERLSQRSERQLINDWLDQIGETDKDIRFEVLDTCAKDVEVRAYYVRMAKGELQ